MGANFSWFKDIEETEKGFCRAKNEECRNHSYGGIYALIEFLKKEGIDFNEFVDYVDGDNDISVLKLKRQNVFLQKLKDKLPVWENRFAEQWKEYMVSHVCSGADDSDSQGAYFLSWIKTWIETMECEYYIVYSL